VNPVAVSFAALQLPAGLPGNSGRPQFLLVRLIRCAERVRIAFLAAWILLYRVRHGRPRVWQDHSRPALLQFRERLPALRKRAQSEPYSSLVKKTQAPIAFLTAALRVAPVPLPSWKCPDMHSLPRSFPRSWMTWRPVCPALAVKVLERNSVAQMVRSFFIGNLH
jgi:hypothetical protein